MSTMEEAVVHVLAARELAEKVAAAREEQRALALGAADPFAFGESNQWVVEQVRQRISATPLDATPLADTIKDLRADALTTAAVVKQLEAELAEMRRLWRCEESFRRAQRGNDWVRYLSALRALQEVEALAVVVLRMEAAC